jgi:glyoxylase-like metal-dependent hydrolase (beta-lactamase superfamily II)
VSPGLAPFAPALGLPAWLCENCGFWQRFPTPPASCPLCLDARHVVPPDGWSFLDGAAARAAHPTRADEVEPGVWRFVNDPGPGIGPSGYVVCTDAGNVAFEGAGVYDEAALDRIAGLGGLRVIAASHPHSYGALHQLQDRFPDAELALHPGDLQWSAALRVTWPFDDVLPLGGGLALHHTGGHFAGHTALHDERRRILFCGDALKFDLDPADARRAVAISTHKAFVRGIPMTHAELRRYRDVFARLAFDQTWTPFEQAANAGRAEALGLVDRQLAGRPSAAPVPLEEL